MSDAELGFLSIADAAAKLADKSLSPVDLVEALIARSERLDPQLNAYLLPCFDQAMDAARKAQAAITAGARFCSSVDSLNT